MDKMSTAMLKMDEYENSSCFLFTAKIHIQVIERVVISSFFYDNVERNVRSSKWLQIS